MASWIKEQDSLEWFDEAYTCKQTNQKPAQLHKKVAAGKLQCLGNRPVADVAPFEVLEAVRYLGVATNSMPTASML